MDVDSSLATISVVLGFLMPPAIAVINRRHWSSEVKGAMAFILCVLAALGTLWYEDKLNTTDIRNTVMLVFGVAIFTYHQFWKPSQIAPTIEKSTG